MKYSCDIRRCPQQLTAEVLGISTSALRKSGAPRNRDGSYHLGKVWKWRAAELEARYAEKTAKPDDPQMERLRRANAEMRELELAERRGELVQADVVRSDVRVGVGILRDGLLALPATVTPQLVGRPEAEVAETLDASLRELLGDLSARFQKLAGGQV